MITRADVSRQYGVSEPTVSNLAKALHLKAKQDTEFDMLRIATVLECKAIGMATAVATQLVAGLHGEMRHVAGGGDRKCWIVFCQRPGKKEFQLSSTSARHLESIIDAFPTAKVLPLHELAARATERISVARARKGVAE